MIEGVDYAFSKPSAAALVAAGKRFACRYGGPGSAGKELTPGELAGLTAAGIAVVANAEGAADGLRDGFPAGRTWAMSAEAHFRGLGMPADRPIYFSVDFDTTTGDWDELDAAMDGAASVIGRSRVGVYGEYSIIAHFASNGKAAWFWQTYAWSAGRWHDAAHIQQYKNGVTIGGADCDLDRAMTADYGQWGVDMTTPAEFLAILQDPRVAALMRAFPWQYTGGGLPPGSSSTLAALTQVHGATVGTLAAHAAKLDQILSAAEDDGNATVVLPPDAIQDLKDIKTMIAALPTADEQAAAARAAADVLDG